MAFNRPEHHRGGQEGNRAKAELARDDAPPLDLSAVAETAHD